MNTIEKRIQAYLSKIPKQKVELGAIDDFEKVFKNAINKDTKISTDLIDDLRKAEVRYKDIQSEYKKAFDIGQRVLKQAKELGIDLPNTFKNQLETTQTETKEANKMISAIKSLYSKF
ncbi:hypothetical protein [uncultured Mediterranean phage uvMED]|nr:hypothetical protein [uncultured Mediterranean phage uvMED]